MPETCAIKSTGLPKLKDKYRFYLEYETKTKRRKATRKNLGDHLGTCVAVILDDNGEPTGWWTAIGDKRVWVYGAIVALFARENSPVCGGSVSVDYLREKCLRICKEKALEIHPNLHQDLLSREDFVRRMNDAY